MIETPFHHYTFLETDIDKAKAAVKRQKNVPGFETLLKLMENRDYVLAIKYMQGIDFSENDLIAIHQRVL